MLFGCWRSFATLYEMYMIKSEEKQNEKKYSDEKREQTNKENMHVTLGIVKKDVLDGSHTVYYIPLRVIVKVKQ